MTESRNLPSLREVIYFVQIYRLFDSFATTYSADFYDFLKLSLNIVFFIAPSGLKPS